jgi:hypothetical protein
MHQCQLLDDLIELLGGLRRGIVFYVRLLCVSALYYIGVERDGAQEGDAELLSQSSAAS